MEQQTAISLKERSIEFINDGLRRAESLELDHCYIKRDARLRSIVNEKEKDGDESNFDYLA